MLLDIEQSVSNRQENEGKHERDIFDCTVAGDPMPENCSYSEGADVRVC